MSEPMDTIEIQLYAAIKIGKGRDAPKFDHGMIFPVATLRDPAQRITLGENLMKAFQRAVDNYLRDGTLPQAPVASD